eukprot:SAG11_NODE_35621_length_265_cov_2.921687_1_plen_66_part_01
MERTVKLVKIFCPPRNPKRTLRTQHNSTKLAGNHTEASRGSVAAANGVGRGPMCLKDPQTQPPVNQ